MSRLALAAFVTEGVLTAGVQFVFVAHGLWLEDTYDMDATQVGFAIVTVGAVEVVATLGSSRLTDGLGKRNSILVGAVVMTSAMALLTVFDAPPLPAGLLLLVGVFLGFEFALVSAIPLVAELDPGARAGMIGRAIALATVVRAVVTLLATWVYVSHGFVTLMTVATTCGCASILLARFVLSEPETRSA